MSLDCRQFIDFLVDYLDDHQDPAMRAEFESHMARCGPCRDYLESYADAIRMAQSLREPCDSLPSVPDELVSAIVAAMRKGGDDASD